MALPIDIITSLTNLMSNICQTKLVLLYLNKKVLQLNCHLQNQTIMTKSFLNSQINMRAVSVNDEAPEEARDKCVYVVIVVICLISELEQYKADSTRYDLYHCAAVQPQEYIILHRCFP